MVIWQDVCVGELLSWELEEQACDESAQELGQPTTPPGREERKDQDWIPYGRGSDLYITGISIRILLNAGKTYRSGSQTCFPPRRGAGRPRQPLP